MSSYTLGWVLSTYQSLTMSENLNKGKLELMKRLKDDVIILSYHRERILLLKRLGCATNIVALGDDAQLHAPDRFINKYLQRSNA